MVYLLDDFNLIEYLKSIVQTNLVAQRQFCRQYVTVLQLMVVFRRQFQGSGSATVGLFHVSCFLCRLSRYLEGSDPDSSFWCSIWFDEGFARRMDLFWSKDSRGSNQGTRYLPSVSGCSLGHSRGFLVLNSSSDHWSSRFWAASWNYKAYRRDWTWWLHF